MAEAKRPLPNLKEYDTRAFWDGTKQKQLRYQQCDDCQTVIFYSRRHCTGCLGSNLSWHTASGKGTVYSYIFRNQIPYAVAWIDLDEGPRLLSNVVGVEDPLNDVSIGQKVEVEWEEHEELSIPLFKPI
jgi:uncharacterized OB-fold protein